MDELDKLIDEKKERIAQEDKKREEQALAVRTDKNITEVSASDIKVVLDASKSVTEQTDNIVEAMSTVSALQDEKLTGSLVFEKSKELAAKAKSKEREAHKASVKAETEVQKAEREAYEGILETFGFFHHLPHWLTRAIVFMLTPFLLLLGFLIGLPCGFIKILIENIDGILCKYNDTDEGAKPKIRITIWVLLGLLVIGAICLTVLACLHII